MTKKATILDVVNKSGYGLGTVSRVISGDKHVRESTRQKIQKVIDELNFTPNVNGARLRKKHSKVIAVLVPVIYHPFFAKFVEKVYEAADQKGYSMIVVASQMNVEKEKEILKKIRQKEVDGAIFVTHYEHDDEELSGLPIVSFDRHLNHHVPFVSTDNYDASKNAVDYLIEKGAKNIAYIGTKPFVDSEVLQREKGYLDALKEHQLTPHVYNEIMKHGEEETLVDELMKNINEYDAIFASGTTISGLIYKKLSASKIKMPEDIQLISYDGIFDNLGTSTLVTSIVQPIEELARGAVNLLVNVINEKEVPIKNIYKTSFIKSGTTK